MVGFLLNSICKGRGCRMQEYMNLRLQTSYLLCQQEVEQCRNFQRGGMILALVIFLVAN